MSQKIMLAYVLFCCIKYLRAAFYYKLLLRYENKHLLIWCMVMGNMLDF